MNIVKALLLTFASAATLVSCSEDSNNEKYASKAPIFSGMQIYDAQGNKVTKVNAGEKFVVVAEQSQKGSLLNATTYVWSIAPSVDGLVHKQNLANDVIYDHQSQNPTDTLTIGVAGTYTLTFKGTYNASGNTSSWGSQYGWTNTQYWQDGTGHVVYGLRGLYGFTVTATKKVVVI